MTTPQSPTLGLLSWSTRDPRSFSDMTKTIPIRTGAQARCEQLASHTASTEAERTSDPVSRRREAADDLAAASRGAKQETRGATTSDQSRRLREGLIAQCLL